MTTGGTVSHCKELKGVATVGEFSSPTLGEKVVVVDSFCKFLDWIVCHFLLFDDPPSSQAAENSP
jgi:hypothetical protein